MKFHFIYLYIMQEYTGHLMYVMSNGLFPLHSICCYMVKKKEKNKKKILSWNFVLFKSIIS